jgi:hypothetical protein
MTWQILKITLILLEEYNSNLKHDILGRVLINFPSEKPNNKEKLIKENKNVERCRRKPKLSLISKRLLQSRKNLKTSKNYKL